MVFGNERLPNIGEGFVPIAQDNMALANGLQSPSNFGSPSGIGIVVEVRRFEAQQELVGNFGALSRVWIDSSLGL